MLKIWRRYGSLLRQFADYEELFGSTDAIQNVWYSKPSASLVFYQVKD